MSTQTIISARTHRPTIDRDAADRSRTVGVVQRHQWMNTKGHGNYATAYCGPRTIFEHGSVNVGDVIGVTKSGDFILKKSLSKGGAALITGSYLDATDAQVRSICTPSPQIYVPSADYPLVSLRHMPRKVRGRGKFSAQAIRRKVRQSWGSFVMAAYRKAVGN